MLCYLCVIRGKKKKKNVLKDEDFQICRRLKNVRCVYGKREKKVTLRERKHTGVAQQRNI